MGSACNSASNSSNKAIIKPALHSNQLIPFARYFKIKKQYNFISIIFQGAFSIVKLYQELYTNKDYFVIKSIDKLQMTKQQYECLVTEIAHLRVFDHPNIVDYFDTFEEEESVNLVLEYLKGRDLYDHYKEVLVFPEAKKCDIMFQILSGLCFFHKANIFHRDIKLENITFSHIGNGDYSVVKLIDFGFATKDKDDRRIGSFHYLSPEMINCKGGAKSDIWALGVVLYSIFTGVFPFDIGDDKQKLFHVIQTKQYDEKALDERGCSGEAKDLLRKLLEKNEEKRPNCFEAINHPWFQKYIIHESTKSFFTNNTFLELINTFKSLTIIKKYLRLFFVRYMNNELLLPFNKLFYALDPNHLGVLKKENLIAQYAKYGIDTDLIEIDTIQGDMFEIIEDRIKYSLFISIMTSKSFREYASNETSLKLLFTSFTFPNSQNIITEHSFISSIKNISGISPNETKIRSGFLSKSQLNYSDFIIELGL